ncbi:MAG: acetate kinase [Clostridia bacterium]|nr:acetate kinase [Clostridia bacterium]MBR2486001.1 acetate kinase [Clostridia bacterium]
MKILVLNAGSSSLKYQLVDMATETAILTGICERITAAGGVLTQKTKDGKKLVVTKDMPTHKEALELVLGALVDPEYGAIKSVDEVSAVGHRVVHGGEDFTTSVVIDDEVVAICERNSDLAPLHNPGNVACIKGCQQVMPGKPMVAVFDTTFHSTIPAKAYMYGIRYEDYEKFKVRKYGFHGTSHKFVSTEVAKYLGNPNAKIIVCHLGNGSSLSAVNAGKCVDTTMGFTPLEGVIMGTRSGDIDAGAVEYLGKKLGKDMGEMVTYLNKKCGMYGLSGDFSSDMRDLEPKMKAGDEKATIAITAAGYRIKKYVGSFAAALNGVDAIVFTGGIGEHSDVMRNLVAGDMQYLGVELDPELNKKFVSGYEPGIYEIQSASSRVKVLVATTNEELSIARETKALVENL